MAVTLIIAGVIALLAGYMFFAYRKVKNQPVIPDHPRIKNLTDKNFGAQISRGITLVDFWAAWCMPCKMMAPTLNDLAGEVDANVTICKVNIDEYQSVARTYSVRSIPTIVIFKNGKEVERVVGVKSKDFLINKLIQCKN
jgi:thioredoxin 1